jgi:hypothetical protein
VCPGQGERQEHHVAGHVGDKDVAKDEVAERIHQARDHGLATSNGGSGPYSPPRSGMITWRISAERRS